MQTAPAIRAALGECFDYEQPTLVTGEMVSALRLLGFDRVFDTNFTADLSIMEEGTELLTRLKSALVRKQQVALAQFTSCSPGRIKYAEYFYPEIIDNISTCKSPLQIFSAVAKTDYARKADVDLKDIVVVSVMLCTAKKFEFQCPEMSDSGSKDIDYVLTARELARMIKQSGIKFRNQKKGVVDSPMGSGSGAAAIFANTGGAMEAAVCTAYEIVTGRKLPVKNLHLQPIAELKGVKKASLKIEECLPVWNFLEGVELKVGVAHKLGNAKKIIETMLSGEEFHFIEAMTRPAG